MADWFYGKNGSQHGPVSEQAIKQLLSTHQIDSATIVWREGMSDWTPISKTPEFQNFHSEGGASTGEAPNQEAPQPDQSTEASPIYAPGQAEPPAFAAPVPTNGLSIASLVCGILAILACYVWGLFGLPAVICGHMALKTIKTSPTPLNGKGMAIAGLVCGYIGIILQLIMIIGGIWLFTNATEQMEKKKAEIEVLRTQQIKESQNREELTPTPSDTPIQNSDQTTPNPQTSEE